MRFLFARAGQVVLVCLSIFFVHALYAKSETVTPTTDIIINLTHNKDSHQASMALHMGQALIKEGFHVVTFLNVNGVDLAVSKNQTKNMDNKSAVSAFALYVKAGGEVWVCPHCLHSAGFKDDELIAQAKLYKPKMLANLLKKPSTKVIGY